MSWSAQKREMAEKLREAAENMAVTNGTSRDPKPWDAGRAQGWYDAADFVENHEEEDEDR